MINPWVPSNPGFKHPPKTYLETSLACNSGLLQTKSGLLWGIVANFFRPLGFPGGFKHPPKNLVVTVRLGEVAYHVLPATVLQGTTSLPCAAEAVVGHVGVAGNDVDVVGKTVGQHDPAALVHKSWLFGCNTLVSKVSTGSSKRR